MMIIDERLTIFISAFVAAYSIMRIVKFFDNNRSTKRLPYPPSLPSLPLIGSLPFLRNFNDLSAFFMAKADQLGPIFTFRVGSKLILVLNTREVIEEALVNNSRSFSSRPDVYADKIINPNRKGITFNAETYQWKRDHQVALTVLKEFGFGVKSVMEERILNEIEAVVEYIRQKDGRAFEPAQLTFLVASNIISDIVFGQRRDYELGSSELIIESDRYAHNLDPAYDIAPFLRFIPPYKQKLMAMVDCCKKIHAILEAEIERGLRNKTNCFAYRYVDKEGDNCDREQLYFVVRDMIIAGTDTVATYFQWLLVALANNQHIQDKLHSEIDSAIPRERLPTLNDQSKLPYHEATVLEIFRWRTVAPLSVARETSDDSELHGFFIPKGTIVLSNLRAAHNNIAVWGDPEVFRPERFLDRDNNIIGRDSVIPFGLGRRSCFGEQLARAETFLLTASISQRFFVLSPEGQERISEKPREPIAITTIPEPFSIRLMKRQ